MYNLNYNVTNARLYRPVGIPQIPVPRVDPYSASLVVAIPGAIFKNGYVNIFNQQFEYDDISAYIVSGSVLNVTTGQYYKQGPRYNCILTQSAENQGFQTGSAYYTASTAVNNFSAQGYNNSMYFSGSSFLSLSSDSSSMSTRGGTNIGTSSNWVMEAYIAYDLVAEVISTSSILLGPNSRTLMSKYSGFPIGSTNGDAYTAMANFTEDTDESAGQSFISGSGRFIGTYATGMTAGENRYYSNNGPTQEIKKFSHFAISYGTGSIAGSAGTLRFYVSGSLIGTSSLDPTNNINSSSIETGLFGGITSAQYGAYFQDFRFYNGTNKNYTASIIPLPESMIKGVFEPYPQYT